MTSPTANIVYGSGKYTVSLYYQISGSKYQKDGEISFTVKMKDKLGYTLYPNQWMNYTAETAAVQYADELCADLTDEYEIIMAVYKFMKKNFSYDWFKSGDVKAGTLKDILPEIDGSWNTKTGICQDLAAIMCAMLRSQGVHAQLVVGTCGCTPHAWVTVYYYGEGLVSEDLLHLTGTAGGFFALKLTKKPADPGGSAGELGRIIPYFPS